MHLPLGNYEYLIQKIDEFIRKYYLNKVIRGCIYLAASLFTCYILITLAEYYGNFEPTVRTILFYSFLALNAFVLVKYILIPLSSYFKLGKTISHNQASEIIGAHFSHIQDKLLNTLQLRKLEDENPAQKDLIRAGIDQKITELKPVPFIKAVKFEENKRYLKFAAAPFIVILLIAFTAPAIFSESTERLIKHNRKFVKKAPFEFVILNKNLSAIQGEDFELKVKLTGDEIPNELFVEDGVNTFKLKKENLLNFTYTFKNLQESKRFRLSGAEYFSPEYLIRIKHKPSLLDFKINLAYPTYTRIKNETLSNTGELAVPEGTKITWDINTGNTDFVDFMIGNRTFRKAPERGRRFNFHHSAVTNTSYSIIPGNKEVVRGDKISYPIHVIKDAYPSIEVTERPDSVNSKIIYTIGKVADDYGFSSLTFNYRLLNQTSKTGLVSKAIKFEGNNLQSSFMHVFNAAELNIRPGQQVEYFFEIRDNDGVNGPKSTRTPLKVYKQPSENEIVKRMESTSQSVKKKLEGAIKQSAEIERDVKRLAVDLIEKKSLSYEERKQIESVLEKQKNLEKLVDEIKRHNQENNALQQDLREKQDESILEKQKQMENLLNNILDEKTRELLRNIEQLLGQTNKNLTQEELSKMQMDQKTLQKEMDRILELYKQLEFDQKLSENIEKLNQIATQQKQLAEQSIEKNVNVQQLKENQNTLNSDFKRLKDSFKELQEKDEQLEQKHEFRNPDKELDKIEQLQQAGKQKLERADFQPASENLKKASLEMQQLAQKLQEFQEQEETEQTSVNLRSLREILKNLLKSSFSQEKVMENLRTSGSNDPNYNVLTLKQKEIKDNLKMIQDSLYALGKKVPQIESVITKEMSSINFNVDKALQGMSERKTAEANKNQQYAMTSMNNLALMLSEVQQQIQKAMKNSGQGKGKQKSLSRLRKMQEQLNQNMENARKQMEQQGKQGQKPGNEQMSEQFGRMVREQQLIRQALQELNRNLSKDGKGKPGNLDKVSKQMEQTETDLVNKGIRQETFIRQQEILTKLLEAEKAERERDLDEKRESKQGRDQLPDLKIVLEEYQKTKQKEIELLKTVPPALNSFYKNKVGDYIKFLNSGK